MNMGIQSIAEVSKLLLDNSTKEIERRNMKVYNRARALNKLSHLFVDRLKKINAPEGITYDSLNKYTQEVQKVFLVTDIDIKNWFPRISPFFIMDRRKFLTIYERARLTYNGLNDFVTKEYVKTKTLEEAFQQLNELTNVQKQLVNLSEEKNQLKNERSPVEKEIVDLEQKVTDLKTQGPIDRLNAVNSEIDSLANNLKHAIRHLQKPFIKMQALATSGGGGGVTPDELAKINQYLEKPLEALATEQPGYPMLKEILEKLEKLLTEDKLKLKDDKARKADQASQEILKQDSLIKLQCRIQELVVARDQLMASPQMEETRRCLAVCQEQLDLLRVKRTSIETHELVKENSYKEAQDKISNLKRTIEKDVFGAISIKIQIV